MAWRKPCSSAGVTFFTEAKTSAFAESGSPIARHTKPSRGGRTTFPPKGWQRCFAFLDHFSPKGGNIYKYIYIYTLLDHHGSYKSRDVRCSTSKASVVWFHIMLHPFAGRRLPPDNRLAKGGKKTPPATIAMSAFSLVHFAKGS